MLGGFRLGRWFGFEIRIDASWFLVFGLVVWTFSELEFPRQLPGHGPVLYYAMGVLGGLVFFLSVLLHELAHSAMARRRGIEVEGITLFIFGGVAQTSMEARRPLDEFLLTIVGPLTSLALAAGFKLLQMGADAFGWPAAIGVVAGFLAFLNLVLAIFNMIPGFPLDGGRIFRSIVWAITGDLEKATRWATWGGRIFGYTLIAFGVVQLFFGLLLAGLWSAFIGWFLSSAAAGSYRQFRIQQTLSRLVVSRIMVRNPVAVGPEMPVSRLIEEYFIRRSDGAYPVVSDGAVLGLVGVEDVARIPAARRGLTTVGEVMRPAGEVPVARPEETLEQIVSRLDPKEQGRVLVVEDDQLIGLLSLGEIGAWVKRARELGVE